MTDSGQFGSWVVDHPVGRGAMATVYRCHHRSDHGRISAVKVLDLPVVTQNGSARMLRFARELRMLQQLEHPNIVGVLDSGMEPSPWIALEFVTGRPLQLARPGARPHREVRDLALQMGGALLHAHHLGIYHRDVKPGNILIEPNGQAWLVDFGVALAAWETPITEPGNQAPATLAYAPPEWFVTSRLDSPAKGDSYGLGVVLWEQLTGQSAFTRSNEPSRMTNMFNDKLKVMELDPGPSVPEPLRAVVRALSAAQVDDRLELAHALLQLRSREPSVSLPPVATPRGVEAPPAYANAAVERDELLAAARERLSAGARLLTLVGAPGVGKTRAAAALVQGCARVAWVSLDGLWQEAHVLDRVARSLGALSFEGVEAARILAEREITHLVLDQFDSAVNALQTWLPRWLVQVPTLTVLATGRGRLGVAGERVVEVPPIEANDAKWLLTKRVEERGGLPTEVSSEAVAPLGGLPLLIEAAANRWPDADQVKANTGRAMALATEPSWLRLEPTERLAFVQASVFAGPFAFDAADSVIFIDGVASPLDVLRRLADRGLITIQRANVRCEMLAPLREDARSRWLDVEPPRARAALQRRHASWFAHVGAVGGAPPPWTVPDLLAAARWSVERSEANLALGATLGLAAHDVTETVRALADRALGLPGGQEELRVTLQDRLTSG